MGMLLLGGVITTLIIMSDPDDLSLAVDVKKAPGKKRYDAQRLAHYTPVKRIINGYNGYNGCKEIV